MRLQFTGWCLHLERKWSGYQQPAIKQSSSETGPSPISNWMPSTESVKEGGGGVIYPLEGDLSQKKHLKV